MLESPPPKRGVLEFLPFGLGAWLTPVHLPQMFSAEFRRYMSNSTSMRRVIHPQMALGSSLSRSLKVIIQKWHGSIGNL